MRSTLLISPLISSSILSPWTSNQTNRCFSYSAGFDPPTKNTVRTIQLEISYNQQFGPTTTADENCIEDFLRSFYSQKKCDINQNLVFIDLQIDNYIVETSNYSRMNYTVFYDYEDFKQRCTPQDAFYLFVNSNILFYQMMWLYEVEGRIVPPSCENRVIDFLQPINGDFHFDNICKYYDCFQQNEKNETFYLSCLDPYEFCLEPQCFPTCGPVMEGIGNDKYCANGATCVDPVGYNWTNPVNEPVCDCSAISTWMTYYVGDKCDGEIYFWWFAVMFAAAIIVMKRGFYWIISNSI